MDSTEDGAVGLSGGRGGIGVFFSPSGGYLIGWIVGAYVIGFLTYRMKNISFVKILLVNILGGIFIVYLFGIPIQAFAETVIVTDHEMLHAHLLDEDVVHELLR